MTTGEATEGRLADNILYFARALRTAGLPVGPGAVLDAVEALQAAGIGTRDDVYWTLHSVFVKRHEHSIIFEQAFRLFFRKRAYLEQLMAMMMPQMRAPATDEKPQAAAQRVSDALFGGRNRDEDVKRESEFDARLTVSDREVLQRKDFAQMSADEIARAKDAIRKLVLPAELQRTRRLAANPRGHVVDMRRTLRASMKGGGAFIDLRYRGPKLRRVPVVALLDISGSMNQYTRVFLHLLHTMTESRRDVHTFLFGTRLTNVSRALKSRDPDDALAACSGTVADWAGGTRIATSLHVFNKQWSRRVLTGGAIVLLFTDGLERDPDDTLAFEMDRLHRSCRHLVWLNPLLRFEGFEAKAKGVRAMLPHVDEFRPIHNLESVATLCRSLDRTAPAVDPKAWLRNAA